MATSTCYYESIEICHLSKKTIFHNLPCRELTYSMLYKLDEFASNIDKEISEIPHFAWGDIDMVFFAFCVSKRYYTMCFCFKRKSVVIIYACKDGEDNDLRFTYGSIPEALIRIQTTTHSTTK
ncbi:hypothetical protein SASPL_109928 [Salvia splendens]|uniref:Uncharacterized protein n=1 Tax=Salvia splendens TaxID=180675 RepID=A0A8X8Y556_SALSN|nr:hypothetical protein SASPL_109928 [Salvia splendens]